MAEEAKAKGNAAFASGDYSGAVRHFTEAISLAPSNHVLYSNRSAAYASLRQYSDALSDARKTVELKPEWSKGYSRLGAAHLGIHQYSDAILAYKRGLEIDPDNDALKSGLADAQSSAAASRPRSGPASSPFGDAFSGPEMWAKLTADPTTRAYLQQPDFVRMMQEIQKSPSSLNLYLKDHRVMQALGVLLNVKLRTAGDDMEIPGEENTPPPQKKDEPPVKESEPEPETTELAGEEKEVKERKALAQKEKEAGNAAYKKKDFDTAIQHYTKATELDDEDISFLTNRAAVYFEMGKYDECINDCDKAVERGRELRSDFKMIARALTRKGTALMKLAKSSKDYDAAIEVFQKALTEHRNPDTLKKLNDAERAKKELEQQEYFDPQIADEEREKGNECFKQHKYPEAVKHYSEAIKRNPQDPRAYSNRAACYTKLGALPEGLKDAEKCIELEPTFAKGYTRKGAIQFFMKEYDKALETYQQGLKHDVNNQELLDGVKRCVEQINKASRGGLSADELKERQAKAMQDPEIQNILTDPVMRQVLMDFQENPKAAQEHMKNPMVMNKIQKLVAAGIVQTKEMDASKVNQLKQFINQCKSSPSILSDPSLSFFRDYLESLGAKLPPAAYGLNEKSKSYSVDEIDEDMLDTEAPHVEDEEEEEEADEIEESDVELEGETVEPDNDPPQKMGDPSVEVTDENREASQEAKVKAMEAISEGKLVEAIEHLTDAITLNPTSAIMYATRASVYIKMKKPNAAIRDANAALEINPDSAKGYKSRGIARALLGKWEEAAKDLHLASNLDYDEEINAVLKKVEPNAHKIEEHRRKYERLRKEREEKRIERERQRRRAEAQASYEKAKQQEQSSSSRKPGGMPGGFPGGMPGGFPGGMPGGFPGGMPGASPGGMPGNVDFSKILNDPELMAAFKDPEVMAALQDVMKNPANLAKHQANPKVAPVIAKMMSDFAGPK
ncbi:hypothetical protein Nepgr_028472 [Nepenthes gracilis]|uniref:STI1 domain-containing protein n=3 Tax=Magnoliopsida TaxID=3398 RepID=A0AAD3TCY7_NEPGR|nr:hypothetical protein Nepgr_028472 [Nepenthes gracilis]